MLISLNWLRDFVDLPATLDVAELARQFTMTCAEVEGVERIEVRAKGLIAAKVASVRDLPGTRNLRHVTLDVGGRTVETVSAAPVLRVGELVVYAPPGASTLATGKIGVGDVAGHASEGMILPGDALGIAMAADEAIFCPPAMSPGEALDPAMLDDWVIEIDNKSITHRPDLWGHYGIAREIAAMLDKKLKPYPMWELAELENRSLPVVPVEIDDPALCPRYTALVMGGVTAQPAPLSMQFRLGHVGMRPIDFLVDLTNYIMAELGQPMHAFDGDKLDRIEVGVAKPGSRFTTLDGVERLLPADALMIMSHRTPVALAGVMGGLETEVSPQTKRILLESANFGPACIRRCAAALGLRTEASARFEKSLDPANTVYGIRRFVHLARQGFAGLRIDSRLSDCYPTPAPTIRVEVDPHFAQRFMGHHVTPKEMTQILTALEFGVEKAEHKLVVTVPSFRATKDISIEADVIEEVARFVGYDNIAPALPEVHVRCFTPNAQHELEKRTLQTLCVGMGFSEIQLYIWYDNEWIHQLGLEIPPAIELRNPAAAGQEYLRHTLMPGLLQATEHNRRHADAFNLCEVGSVFPGGPDSHEEERHLGLIVAKRGRDIEDDLLAELKGLIEAWAWQTIGRPATYLLPEAADLPAWAHEYKTACVVIGGRTVGMASVVPLVMRRRMDEHLANWGIAWAQIALGPLAAMPPVDERRSRVPEFPEVELDFSMLVDAVLSFNDVSARLSQFDDPLLRRISYVGAYEGKSIPPGKRSLTYRTRIGAADRTLVENDLVAFRNAFEKHISACGFELRR